MLLVTCPDSKQLQQLVTGQLNESLVPALEDHFSHCPHCLAQVESLPTSDRLERDLRQWALHESQHPLEHTTIPQLIHHLRQLPAGADWQPSSIFLSRALQRTSAVDWRAKAASQPLPVTGRYRLIRMLGAGGMGSVYLADDPQLGRTVAVKIPHTSVPSEARDLLRKRFQREAQLAASIRHPNVCPIYDVGGDNAVPYVVMAYIEGSSLADRLRHERRLTSIREAVSLAVEMAQGLAAVHAAGVVHRDLKPGNVLLDAQGRVLLSDFGLACWPEADRHLAAAGTVVGTPAYVAPEQISSTFGPVTLRCDLYSLGVVLYQMLTGRLPFEAREPRRLFDQVLEETPPSPSSLRPEIHATLQAIVCRAMARKPEHRYQTAEDLAGALQTWLREDALVAPTPLLGTKLMAAPSRRRAVRKRWLALGTILALVAGLLFVLGHSDRAGGPGDGPTETTSQSPNQGWLEVQAIRGHRIIEGIRLGPHDVFHAGNLVRFRITSERPGYLYLIWINSAGEVVPLYPWKDRNWDLLEVEQPRVQHLSLPSVDPSGDYRWAVEEGPPGKVSLVMLMRDTPLDSDVHLDREIGRVPPDAKPGEILRHQENVAKILRGYGHFSRTFTYSFTNQ